MGFRSWIYACVFAVAEVALIIFYAVIGRSVLLIVVPYVFVLTMIILGMLALQRRDLLCDSKPEGSGQVSQSAQSGGTLFMSLIAILIAFLTGVWVAGGVHVAKKDTKTVQSSLK